MSKITNSYLMWVGAEHYSDISSYATEAVNLGISKRVPNLATAQALSQPGTVVFLAHDEHNYHECPDCLGTIECPECRKRSAEISRIEGEVEKLEAERADIFGLGKTDDGVSDEQAEKVARLTRLIDNRAKKLEKLVAESADAACCGGKGEVEAGTGGTATVDGETWDYRRYNYWLHQPKAFNKERATSTSMCPTCGGTGRLPDTQVFGLFLPVGIEYIAHAEDTEEKREELRAAGASILETAVVETEAKRGCGKRKPGGLYVVTKPGAPVEATKELVEELTEAGMIDGAGVDVNGSFIHFNTPVKVDGLKRFRGLKRWTPTTEAADEAEMIVEALDD